MRACCTIHNLIRMTTKIDHLFTEFDVEGLMQDNNEKQDKCEKEDRNRTNPKNHHLESAYKTLGITTFRVFGITTKQRRETHLKS